MAQNGNLFPFTVYTRLRFVLCENDPSEDNPSRSNIACLPGLPAHVSNSSRQFMFIKKFEQFFPVENSAGRADLADATCP